MTLYPPLWMQPQGGDTAPQYSALTDRQLILSLWDTEGPIWGLQVTQRGAGANMSVDVAPGMAVVTGNDVSPQGTYFVSSDATVNVTVPAPPASGTRKHRLVAHVRDRLYDGTLPNGTYDWVLECLEDTGSGTPPAQPTAITLAFINVAAGQSSVTNTNIEDRRLHALSRPGRARVIADDSGLPAVPVEAEQVWQQDMSCHRVSDGTFWYEMPHRDSGGTASGSPWDPYTPTVTALTTSPNLGTGATRQGTFYWLGRLVHAQVVIKFGSGSSAGSGIYEISLPTPARSQSVGRRTGSAYAYSHSNDFEDGVCFIEPAATDKVRVSIGGTVVTNTAPWAWTNGDELGFNIVYEAA